jgi:hypothetical protein
MRHEPGADLPMMASAATARHHPGMASLLRAGSAHARLLARVRFAVRSSGIAPGDRVEFVVPVGYVRRTHERHLAFVPAGMRGVVRDIAPMPGCSGGAIVELIDEAGQSTGYWTGAALTELRRIR